MKSCFREIAFEDPNHVLPFYNIPFIFSAVWLFWLAILEVLFQKWFLIVPIFFVAGVVWLIRSAIAVKRGYETRCVVMFVPYCFAFCAFLALTNTPKWVHFLVMKPTLEEVRRNPAPFLAQDESWRQKWSQIRSVTLSKSKKAVRVIVWDEGFVDTTFVGYAHCPNGCDSENFDDITSDDQFPIKTITHFSFTDNWHLVSYTVNYD